MIDPTSRSEAPPPLSTRAKVVLLAKAGGLGLLLAVTITVVDTLRRMDLRPILLGLDGLRLPLAVAGLALLAGVLALCYFRPRLRTLALAITAVGMLSALLLYCFRIESFYGNLVPRFTWRWAPTAEEKFVAYLAEQSTRTDQVVPPLPMDVRFSGHDHPQLLGPTRDGRIENVRLDARWDLHPPRPLWRHPVGLGWAGFAVVGDLAVTQEQRAERECVVGYDLHTGEQRWVHADPVRFRDEHGDGPRATPAIDQGHVYTLGATGLLNCLDAVTGELIWQQATLEDPDRDNLLWGMSGSPLLYQSWVIVSPGAGPGRSVMAFDRSSGRLAWSGGDDPAAYAAPTVLSTREGDQLLCFNGAGLRGFSFTGEPLWLAPWVTQGDRQRVNVAQPIALPAPADAAADVLISSGYSMGAARIRVRCDQGQWSAEPLWHSRALKSKMSNFVVHDGYAYGMDNGVLTCIETQSGQRQWKRGRYGHGQLLLIHDVLLIHAESGDLVLVQADPSAYHELARMEALADKTWNHPALAGNILVIRNDREAAAYELPVRGLSHQGTGMHKSGRP